MARTKTLSDLDVLQHAFDLIRRDGPEALTFASLASACGLSGATLVQRFGSKAELRQRALLHAWDLLDQRTADLIAAMPATPDGARKLLVELSRDYSDVSGGADAFAEGLLLLREDMRDPLLRARGAAWGRTLARALDACFAGRPGTPKDIGKLLAQQWQGALIWWAFDPRKPAHEAVNDALKRFLAALAR